MKRCIHFLFVLTSALVLLLPFSAFGQDAEKVYSNAYDGFVNIRSGPSSEAETLGVLRNGAEGAVLLDRSNPSWWKVKCDGVIGYVRSNYLQKTPTPAVNPDLTADWVTGIWVTDGAALTVMENGCFECIDDELRGRGRWRFEGNDLILTFASDGDWAGETRILPVDLSQGTLGGYYIRQGAEEPVEDFHEEEVEEEAEVALPEENASEEQAAVEPSTQSVGGENMAQEKYVQTRGEKRKEWLQGILSVLFDLFQSLLLIAILIGAFFLIRKLIRVIKAKAPARAEAKAARAERDRIAADAWEKAAADERNGKASALAASQIRPPRARPARASAPDYKTSVVEGLKVNRQSVDTEDFIDVLNFASTQLNCISNLGSFVDITSVEHSETYSGIAENMHLRFTTAKGEVPGATLESDDSSTRIEDYDYSELVHEMIERDE